MRFLRWFFGLPDPTLDSDIAHLGSSRQRALRLLRSPFWRAVDRAHRSLSFRALQVGWAHLWHGTIGRWIYVKCAHGRGEAATMRFVASRTAIPLPRVWLSFQHPFRRGTEVIFMDKLTGTSLEDAWHRLSDKKAIIAEQLERYVSQLRALPPPSGLRSICSVTGGPIRCFRLHADATTGPFRDEEHMNLQLRHLQPLDDPRIPEIVRKVHSTQHPLVFTHNDFFPRNIMIDEESAKVVAVLDWESAGWFPSHWEYCKSINWCTWKVEEEWRTKYLQRIIPVYEEEAEADRALMYDCNLSSYMSPWVHA